MKTTTPKKEEEENLSSIAPKQVKPDSIFSQKAAATIDAGEATIENVEEKGEEVIEDIEPVVEQPIGLLYYEITLIDKTNGEEKILYSEEEPLLKAERIILTRPFGRYDFKEIVLSKKRVAISCKSAIAEEIVELDLRDGALLKAIAEQPWMKRGFEETQKMFDNLVLQAYRIINEELAGKIPVATAKKKQNTLPNEQFVDITNQPVKRNGNKRLDAAGNIIPDRPPGTFLNDL